MATKKISLNEFRSIVKQIIKEEHNGTLRYQLHALVGNAMRLEKRADMSGAEHHVEAHKEAQMELNRFLKQNPSMMDHLETVEDHFMKQLYR